MNQPILENMGGRRRELVSAHPLQFAVFVHEVTARERRLLYHLSLLLSVFGWSFYNLECLQDSVLPGPIWKIFKLHKVYKTKISHIMG